MVKIMESETIVKRLRTLGLSSAQANIYLCLLRAGTLRIHELAAKTQLPRSSVYEALRILYGLGLAEEIHHASHKAIRANPISSLQHHLDDEQAALKAKQAELAHLKTALTSLETEDVASLLNVRYYKGVSGARQLLWNTLQAKNTIYVYSAWGRSSYVGTKFYANFVSASHERAMQEQVLINPREFVVDSIYAHLDSPTSRTRLKDIRTVDLKTIPIHGETFIYNSTYAQIYLKEEEIHGFEIDSTQFAEMQRALFKTLWVAAKPL